MAPSYTGTYTSTAVGNDTVLVLKSSGTLTLDKAYNGRLLLIGGGGGGGITGGGGAGGFVEINSWSITAGSYSITIGGGGSAGVAENYYGSWGRAYGSSGGNTTAFGYTALGGGGGAGNGCCGAPAEKHAALTGGSGGGGNHGDYQTGAASIQNSTYSYGYGYAGGNGGNNRGGGGGGAGAAGNNSTSGGPGNGGAGRASDITGTLTYYAGGGGGSWNGYQSSDSGGSGGIGGGGSGATDSRYWAGSGTANTGSGGGGGCGNGGRAGYGGSGVVILRLAGTYNIVSSANEGGTISPKGTTAVDVGASQKYTITAQTNYYISQILVDGSAIALTDRSSQEHTFFNVSAEHTIQAVFALKPKITVTPGANGSISPGTAHLDYGANATYDITAQYGYHIASITADGRDITVTDYQTQSYSFKNVISNHTLSATFAINPYITSSAGDHGSISPAGKTMVPYGQLRSFNIEANEGYFIQEVQVDGQAVVNTSRQKRTYAFIDVREDHTISASFSSSPTITATVTGSGTITSPGATAVNYGQDLTYTIQANKDSYIHAILVDGVEIEVTDQEKQEYTFENVTDNHSTEASFNNNPIITSEAEEGGSIYPLGETSVDYGGFKTFTVRAKAAFFISTVTIDGNPAPISDTSVEQYEFADVTENHTILAAFADRPTITALAGTGGSITPPGTQYYNEGDSQTYKVTAKTGYYIASLLVDGQEKATPGQNKITYQFDDIQQSSTIQAFFEKLPKITATASTGGTINPKGTTTIPYGLLQKYTVTANDDYLIASILVDGESIEITNLYEQLYPFVNVTTDHTISATFTPRPVITATAGAGGSITPAGKTALKYNGSQTFTIQADSAHSIASIKVDGQEIDITDLQTQSYTFKKVVSNHKIAVLFTERPKITATASEGGTINPDGTNYFAYGSDCQYVIKANQGYCLASIKVDGKDIPVTGTSSQTYQFANITESHVIEATFTTGQTITATAGEGGSIDPEGVISIICGASRTFTITADKGYRIGSIVVDGLEVPIKDLYLQTYNFSHVNEDHTIEANFLADPVITATAQRSFDGYYKNVGFYADDCSEPTAILQEYCSSYGEGECSETICCVNRDDHLTYNVCKLETGECVVGETPTLVIGGSITPEGAISVTYGNSQTFSVTAKEGYYINRIVVDGQDQLILNRNTQDYTFGGVVEDHIIEAWFAPGSKPPGVKITVITNRCAGEKNPAVEEMVDAFNRLKFINANKEIELEVITGDNLKDSDGNVRTVLWDPTIDLVNIFIQDSQTIKGRALTCEELQTCFDWAPEKNFKL